MNKHQQSDNTQAQLEKILDDYVLVRRYMLRDYKNKPPSGDPKDEVVEALIALICSKQVKAIKEYLEDLLSRQDQERDLDGRSIGEPYYIIQGDNRDILEAELSELKSQKQGK